MCKKLFRTTPPRSSRPPPPPPSSTGGFWSALLERLSGAPRPPSTGGVESAAFHELAAALQVACPPFWRSAELRIALAAPANAILSRGDDPHERLDLTPRLVAAIHDFARDRSVDARAGRVYLVVVERQQGGQWAVRCTTDPLGV